MSEEMTQQMMAAAERLATAAEALDRVLERIDAQQDALNAKVDRIVAAVEEQLSSDEAGAGSETQDSASLQSRVAELERANTDLKAQAVRMTRKTLPAAVSALIDFSRPRGLAKSAPSATWRNASAADSISLS